MLASGTPERGFKERARLTDTREAEERWLDGSRGAGDFELYAVSKHSLERFDGRTFERVDNGRAFDGLPCCPRVAWAGPDEAFTVGEDACSIGHYRGGAYMREPLPEPGDDAGIAANIPGFGVVIGTSRGHVHRRDGGEWRKLATVPGSIFALAPLDGGVLVGGRPRLVQQLRPDGAGLLVACDAQFGVVGATPGILVPVADGFVTTWDDPTIDPTTWFVTRLVRQNPPPRSRCPE